MDGCCLENEAAAAYIWQRHSLGTCSHSMSWRHLCNYGSIQTFELLVGWGWGWMLTGMGEFVHNPICVLNL